MNFFDEFLQIAKVKGVDQYILLDNRGKIMATTMKHAEQVSHMVFNCGQNISTIGRSNFKYAVFSKKNGKDILIFPVGNYTLGMVKQKNIAAQVVVDAVFMFFNTLLKKKNICKGDN